MLNIERFHELCRRIEREGDATSVHKAGKQMVELLQDEELELLAREREETYKHFTT